MPNWNQGIHMQSSRTKIFVFILLLCIIFSSIIITTVILFMNNNTTRIELTTLENGNKIVAYQNVLGDHTVKYETPDNATLLFAYSPEQSNEQIDDITWDQTAGLLTISITNKDTPSVSRKEQFRLLPDKMPVPMIKSSPVEDRPSTQSPSN